MYALTKNGIMRKREKKRMCLSLHFFLTVAILTHFVVMPNTGRTLPDRFKGQCWPIRIAKVLTPGAPNHIRKFPYRKGARV